MLHAFDTKTLSEYLDDRLSRDLSAKIKAHIEECPLCLERAAGFKLAKRMLGSLEALEVSEGFDFEFNRRLNQAIAEAEKLSILEKAAQQILEGIRTITPPVPALAKAVVSVLLFVAIAIGTPYYFAKSPLSILSLSGNVAIYSSREQKWITASKGMTLSGNDIVRTGRDSQIDIVGNGLFTIRLKGDSELKTLAMLPRFRKGLISYEVAKGEILVDITEKFKGSRFEIYTPQALAKARGTSFAMAISGAGGSDKTWLAVIDGIVEIGSRYPIYAAKEAVLVKAGQKTEVLYSQPPTPPSLLLEEEWNRLKELYQIGRRPQVVLLISATESRVRELLKPCSLYIYDVEPRTISKRLEKAVENISEAIVQKDIGKHLEAIKELELIVEEDPGKPYNAQVLLFIGTYYGYLAEYDKAIQTFERIVDKYPDSQFASLAECAIGIIYNEKLGKKASAREIFESIILNYPDSLEALEARKALESIGS